MDTKIRTRKVTLPIVHHRKEGKLSEFQRRRKILGIVSITGVKPPLVSMSSSWSTEVVCSSVASSTVCFEAGQRTSHSS